MDTNKPRVTLVVAAYNLEHCIDDSIASLRRQTYDGGMEILICEDCSRDNTYALVQALAQEDNRIRVIRNEVNSGQALGRNRCFALARGEYIAIHDGDDFSREDRIEKQAAFLDAHPEYAFVASVVSTVDDGGRVSDRPYTVCGEVAREDFLWGQPFIHPTTMFRADALRQAGGYRVTPRTRYRNEDYDLFMRMYAMGMKGYVLPERLYVYFEGAAALRRRKYRYRLAEAQVRYENFRRLGLMPRGLPYAIKPLVVGLFPQTFLNRLRTRYYRQCAGQG